MGIVGQRPRKGSVVVKGDEGPEGGVSRDYVGGGNDIVEAISVRRSDSWMQVNAERVDGLTPQQLSYIYPPPLPQREYIFPSSSP